MADYQTLAAAQEILLKARIAFTTGTEAEWTAANPVLKNGEIGFITGSSPSKFKIGDGVKSWSALGWGNVTSLAQLAADSTHRLVTDTQIADWNGRAEVFVFNHQAYLHPPTDVPNPQKQVVRDIVAAINAGKDPVIIALNVQEEGLSRTGTASGYVTITTNTETNIVGRVGGIAMRTDVVDSATKSLYDAYITFNADGTVTTQMSPITNDLLTPNAIVDTLTSDSPTLALSAKQGKALKTLIDNKVIPAYTMEKVTTEAGFASTYVLKKDNVKVGASINIPLDQVLRGSSIKTITTANSPYTGAKVGDKYVEFLFQNNNTPQYLPVQDLVDVYTADNVYIQVSAANVISVKYDALKTKIQTDLGSVFDPKGAGAAAANAAITAFAAKDFVIKCTIPGLN